VTELARHTTRAVRCDWTAVARWDASAQRFRVAAADRWQPALPNDGVGAVLDPARVRPLALLLARETIAFHGPSAEQAAQWRRWDVASCLVAPMARAHGPVGALALGFRHRQGAFSPWETSTARTIAAHATAILEAVRARDAAEREARIRSELLGAVAHDLRAPVSAILGYTDLMLERLFGPLTEEQADVLRRVQVNGQSVVETAAMVLDATRVEGGRLPLSISDFSLRELLAELESEFSARPVPPSVRLEWPAVQSRVAMRTDRGLLKVAVRNLVNNALQFTPSGHVVVGVEGAPADAAVRIVVRDTGVGIAREVQGVIFDLFEQGTRTEAPRGSVGLGLYLVRRFVGLLGGHVAVDSAPGCGSTFTIAVPCTLTTPLVG